MAKGISQKAVEFFVSKQRCYHLGYFQMDTELSFTFIVLIGVICTYLQYTYLRTERIESGTIFVDHVGLSLKINDQKVKITYRDGGPRDSHWNRSKLDKSQKFKIFSIFFFFFNYTII